MEALELPALLPLENVDGDQVCVNTSLIILWVRSINFLKLHREDDGWLFASRLKGVSAYLRRVEQSWLHWEMWCKELAGKVPGAICSAHRPGWQDLLASLNIPKQFSGLIQVFSLCRRWEGSLLAWMWWGSSAAFVGGKKVLKARLPFPAPLEGK